MLLEDQINITGYSYYLNTWTKPCLIHCHFFNVSKNRMVGLLDNNTVLHMPAPYAATIQVTVKFRLFYTFKHKWTFLTVCSPTNL